MPPPAGGPTAAPRAALPDASRPAFPGGAARRAGPRSPRARCRRRAKPAFSSAWPASIERWPLRQISTTGRFMLATFFTCPTKWGLISQSGPSFHATWCAPTGWPTKKYSISDRQSMKTADGCWCRQLVRLARVSGVSWDGQSSTDRGARVMAAGSARYNLARPSAPPDLPRLGRALRAMLESLDCPRRFAAPPASPPSTAPDRHATRPYCTARRASSASALSSSTARSAR